MRAEGEGEMEEAVGSPGGDDLETAYVAFAQAVLRHMNLWADQQEVRFSYEPKVHFTDTSYAESWETVVSYRQFLVSHYEEIAAMPATLACLQAHADAGILCIYARDGTVALRPVPRQILEDYASMAVASDLLSPLLEALEDEQIFQRGREFILSNDAILNSYRLSRVHWARELNNYIVPLVWISSTLGDRQDVGRYLGIETLKTERKTTLWNRIAIFDGKRPDIVSFGAATVALTATTSLDAGGFPLVGRQEILKDIEIFVTALRLLKPGRVGAVALLTEGVAGPSLVTGADVPDGCRGYWEGPYSWSVPLPGSCKLEPADLSSLRYLVNAIYALGPIHHGLAVALRRFNQSYGRELVEDAVIDLMIALDSSLLHHESASAPLLAKRGANLLGGTRVRKETYDVLYFLYHVRNFVVHDSAVMMDIPNLTNRSGESMAMLMGRIVPPLDSAGIPDRCKEIVRAILAEYLNRLVALPSSSDPLAAINQTLNAPV